jgi:hypothetical protein
MCSCRNTSAVMAILVTIEGVKMTGPPEKELYSRPFRRFCRDTRSAAAAEAAHRVSTARKQFTSSILVHLHCSMRPMVRRPTMFHRQAEASIGISSQSRRNPRHPHLRLYHVICTQLHLLRRGFWFRHGHSQHLSRRDRNTWNKEKTLRSPNSPFSSTTFTPTSTHRYSRL